MKSENFQSNIHNCYQKIKKLKHYCSKKNIKLLECTANYLDNSERIACKNKLDQL